VGAWFCIKELNDERVFIVLYAVFASYFAGVMIRLMLTLTPCVCVLGKKKIGDFYYLIYWNIFSGNCFIKNT
jgi:asparagine N-glycosylation enzyme membrane subunit Stt3